METGTLTREKLNQMDHDELVEAYMTTQKKVRDQKEEIELLTEELNHVRAMMPYRTTAENADKAHAPFTRGVVFQGTYDLPFTR